MLTPPGRSLGRYPMGRVPLGWGDVPTIAPQLSRPRALGRYPLGSSPLGWVAKVKFKAGDSQPRSPQITPIE